MKPPPAAAVGTAASSYASEPPPLTLALGILSTATAGTTKFDRSATKFRRRREVIRGSWLLGRSDSVRAHFILRCGGLNATANASLHNENASAGDILCMPVLASEARQRGPILALWHW